MFFLKTFTRVSIREDSIILFFPWALLPNITGIKEFFKNHPSRHVFKLWIVVTFIF